MEARLVFGMAAAACSLVGTMIYLRDVGAGRTHPYRWTWLVWSIIGVVTVASHRAEGGQWSLIMVAGQASTTIVVFVVSLRRGVGGATPANLVMLAVAIAGVMGWAMSSQPIVATAFMISADMVGVVLMLPKTWADPHSETLSSFALGVPTGVCGALSVGRVDAGLLMFPVYFILANGLTAVVIALGRRARVRIHHVDLVDPARLAARG